mmetsp:Transcript_12246/g.25098  ORF Transcript_12246/g.25098 Transcript_12246/m.25098 type:complete len:387 (-) Transcript_12246:26-1186(-)
MSAPMNEDPPQLTPLDSIISYYTTVASYNPMKGKRGGTKGQQGQPEPTFHCLLPGDLRVNPDPNYHYVAGDLRGYHDSWASAAVLGQSLGPLEPRDTPPESLILRPRMEKKLKTQPIDNRLFSGISSHLTDRQKYDIYMENVALTLQRKVIVKKREDEEEKVKQNRLAITMALSNEEREMELLKEREGQMQLQAEMEERRRQAQAELGGMAIFGGAANKAKVKKAMEDQELVKATSAVLKEFIDQIYALQFGAAKINPFRQELNDDFFKLYPEYKEKCPFPMDLVKMKDKNEGLLYGVDLKSILTDCQLMCDNAMNWNNKGDHVYVAAEQLGTIDIPRLVREICIPKLKEVKKKFKKIKKEKEKKKKEAEAKLAAATPGSSVPTEG